MQQYRFENIGRRVEKTATRNTGYSRTGETSQSSNTARSITLPFPLSVALSCIVQRTATVKSLS